MNYNSYCCWNFIRLYKFSHRIKVHACTLTSKSFEEPFLPPSSCDEQAGPPFGEVSVGRANALRNRKWNFKGLSGALFRVPFRTYCMFVAPYQDSGCAACNPSELDTITGLPLEFIKLTCFVTQDFKICLLSCLKNTLIILNTK